MALRNLTLKSMVEISEPWVTKGSDARGQLEKIPEAAIMIPHLESAHATLVDCQAPSDEELKTLIDEETDLDLRHDELAQGIYKAFEAFAHLTGDLTEAKKLLKARSILFPKGIRVINETYRQESSSAQDVREKITKKLEEFLRAQNTPHGTLYDHIDEWLTAASWLGEMEDEREQTEAQLAKKSGAGGVARARNGWVRVVNQLLGNLEFATVEPEVVQNLLAPLRNAEQEADTLVAERRAAKAAKKAEDAEKAASSAFEDDVNSEQ